MTMQFDEMGNRSGKTLMLLPGTACDYQTNFGTVLERLGEKYHLICVNYDGFDGSDLIFPDMITVTGKIERKVYQGPLRRENRWRDWLIFREHLCGTADPEGKRAS